MNKEQNKSAMPFVSLALSESEGKPLNLVCLRNSVKDPPKSRIKGKRRVSEEARIKRESRKKKAMGLAKKYGAYSISVPFLLDKLSISLRMFYREFQSGDGSFQNYIVNLAIQKKEIKVIMQGALMGHAEALEFVKNNFHPGSDEYKLITLHEKYTPRREK